MVLVLISQQDNLLTAFGLNRDVTRAMIARVVESILVITLPTPIMTEHSIVKTSAQMIQTKRSRVTVAVVLLKPTLITMGLQTVMTFARMIQIK